MIFSVYGPVHTWLQNCTHSPAQVQAHVLNSADCFLSFSVLQEKTMAMRRECVEHGLLCVADPQFERSGAVCVVYDELDMGFLGPIMDQAERIWRMAVLPMLLWASVCFCVMQQRDNYGFRGHADVPVWPGTAHVAAVHSTLSCVLDHPIVDVHLMTCCCFDCSVRVPTGRGAVSCSVSEFVYFVHYGCGYNCLAYEIFE